MRVSGSLEGSVGWMNEELLSSIDENRMVRFTTYEAQSTEEA